MDRVLPALTKATQSCGFICANMANMRDSPSLEYRLGLFNQLVPHLNFIITNLQECTHNGAVAKNLYDEALISIRQMKDREKRLDEILKANEFSTEFLMNPSSDKLVSLDEFVKGLKMEIAKCRESEQQVKEVLLSTQNQKAVAMQENAELTSTIDAQLESAKGYQHSIAELNLRIVDLEAYRIENELLHLKIQEQQNLIASKDKTVSDLNEKLESMVLKEKEAETTETTKTTETTESLHAQNKVLEEEICKLRDELCELQKRDILPPALSPALPPALLLETATQPSAPPPTPKAVNFARGPMRSLRSRTKSARTSAFPYEDSNESALLSGL
jgi:chromosome segregation ATPase